MTTIDLTGDWEGHYVQNGGRHGISMRVVQRGASFVGRMRDVDTLMASRQELRAPTDDAELLGEADVLSTLPEHSTVEGEAEGRVVTFVKRYHGKSTTTVSVAGRTMNFTAPGHAVQYRGTLDAPGDELAGHWSIDAVDGGKPLRDRFLLR
ncbi:MAG: hypothetical protein JNK15_21910, partial [Planctomycetes bacterium]|nr:hypothetical protein [Planctomycetota bacterium]